MESEITCLCDIENPTEYLTKLKEEYLARTARLQDEQEVLEQKILQFEEFLSQESTNAGTSRNKDVPKIFPKYQDTPTREEQTCSQVPRVLTEAKNEPCGFFQKFRSMLSMSKCTNPDIHDPPTRENDHSSDPLTSQFGTKSFNQGEVSRSSSLVCNCDESDVSTSRDVSDSGTSCLTCVGSEAVSRHTKSFKTQTKNPSEVQVRFSNKEFSKTSHSQTPRSKSVDRKTPDGDVKLCQCDSSFVDNKKLGVDIFSSPEMVETISGPDIEPKKSCSANKAKDESVKSKSSKSKCGARECPAERESSRVLISKEKISAPENSTREQSGTIALEKASSGKIIKKNQICSIESCSHRVKKTKSEQVNTQHLPQRNTATDCTAECSTNFVQASAENRSTGLDPHKSEELRNKSVSSCNLKTCPSRTRSVQCAFVGSPLLRPTDFDQAPGDQNVNKQPERPTTPQRSKSCECRNVNENQMFSSKNAASLPNHALDNMKDITELAAKEKMLQEQMNCLKEKEKSYEETSKNAKDVLNQSSCICNSNFDAPKTTADLENEIKRVSNELKVENNILKSELMEMKLQLKHTLENIEGPMKQKLQTEKMKCECLQDELNQASQSLIVNQDTYQREMNCLKMQLCIACSNITELNQMNERMKNQMKQLDCLCNKLEDDLVRQKLNEADTIKRLTSRKAFGAGEGPSTNEFRCPPDLAEITRQLSKTLREVPCDECSNVPKELRGAAKCIKDLADMVLSNKKLKGSESCICKNAASRGDFQELKSYGNGCSCQSMSDIPEEEVECDCECCCGGDTEPKRKKRAVEEKTVKTIHPAAANFAEKGASSQFDVDMEQSKFFSTTSHPPCADVGTPCSKGTMLKTLETGTGPCDEIGRPCSKVTETQAGEQQESKKPCGDIGTPCDKDMEAPLREDKECLAPCSKEQETITDKDKEEAKASESVTNSIRDTVAELVEKLPLKDRLEKADREKPTKDLPEEPKIEGARIDPEIKDSGKSGTEAELAPITEEPNKSENQDGIESIDEPKKVHMGGSLPFDEKRSGDFPFDTTTRVDAIDEPPQGLHVTTTITGSGTLEVITEGPEGVIETTLTYTDDGNIEVVTEMVDYKEQKPKEILDKLTKDSSEIPPGIDSAKHSQTQPGKKLRALPVDSSVISGPSPAETPFSVSQVTPTELTSHYSSISHAEPLACSSTLTSDGGSKTEHTDYIEIKQPPSKENESRPPDVKHAKAEFVEQHSIEVDFIDKSSKVLEESVEKHPIEADFIDEPSKLGKTSDYIQEPSTRKIEAMSDIENETSRTSRREDMGEEIEAGEITGEEILSSELTSHPDISHRVEKIDKPSEKHIDFEESVKPLNEARPSEEIVQKHTDYEVIPAKEKIRSEETPVGESGIKKISKEGQPLVEGIKKSVESSQGTTLTKSELGTESAEEKPSEAKETKSDIQKAKSEQSDAGRLAERPREEIEAEEKFIIEEEIEKEDEQEKGYEKKPEHEGEVEKAISVPEKPQEEPDDIKETEPSPLVKKRVDCSCQSKSQKDQSCQCCECKEVGITTSGDKETTTDEQKTMGQTPEEHTQDSDSEFVTISETTEPALAEDIPKQAEGTEEIISQATTEQPTTEGVVSAEIQPEQVGDYLPIQDITVVPLEEEEPPENLLGPSEVGSTEVVRGVEINEDVLAQHPELVGKSSAEQREILQKLSSVVHGASQKPSSSVNRELSEKSDEKEQYRDPTVKKPSRSSADEELVEKHPEPIESKDFGGMKPHKLPVDKDMLEKHPELVGKSSEEQQEILKNLGYKHSKSTAEEQHRIITDKEILEKTPKLIGKFSEGESEALQKPKDKVERSKIKVDKNLLDKHPELVGKSSEEQQKLLRSLGYKDSKEEMLDRQPEISDEDGVKAPQDGIPAKSSKVDKEHLREATDFPKEPPAQSKVTQDLLNKYPELAGMTLKEQMDYLKNQGVLPSEVFEIDEELIKKHLEGKTPEEQRAILEKLGTSRGVSDESREHLRQLLLNLVPEIPPSEETQPQPTVDKSVSCKAICRTQATVYDESQPIQPEDKIGDVAATPSFDKTFKTSSKDIPTSRKTSASCKASCKTVTMSEDSVSATKSTERSRSISTQERPRSVEESASCRASCRAISVQGSTPKVKESGLSPKQQLEELVPARKKESSTSSSSEDKIKDEKKKKKRGPEEVPSIVSELSDKDLAPPVDKGRGKPRKKRSTSKSLGAIKCNCGDVCRCIICAPDVMDKRAGSCVCSGPTPQNMMPVNPMMMQPQQHMMMMMQQMRYPGYPTDEHSLGCTCRDCRCDPCTPCPNTPDNSERSNERKTPEKNEQCRCKGKQKKQKKEPEKPVFIPHCDCPGDEENSTSPEETNFRCHAKDCECVDCLTMPKIKKLAQTKEYPVVYDKKQVYQVNCDCENAKNAKAFMRSRIPVPIRGQQPGQPGSQPSATHQPRPEPDGVTQTPTSQPSASTTACDCTPCLCEDCPDPSIPKRGPEKCTKQMPCCCTGPCDCQSCPVEPLLRQLEEARNASPPIQQLNVQISPSPQQQGAPHPEDCTCPECTECPGSDQMRTPTNQPTQPISQTESKSGPPGQTASRTGPPSHTQSKTDKDEEFLPCECDDPCDCPGEKPKAPGGDGDIPCDCDDPCDCPGEKPKKGGKAKPEGHDEDCECDTCDCPGLKPTRSVAEKPSVNGKPSVTGRPSVTIKTPGTGHPEGCTCELCQCPGLEETEMSSQPTVQKTGSVPQTTSSQHQPVGDGCQVCNCCNICACPGRTNLLKKVPSAKQSGVMEPIPEVTGDVPCDCEDCKCDPCADPKRTKKSPIEGIPSKIEHPADCECDECKCLETILHTDEPPVVTSKIGHPPDCDCGDCKCQGSNVQTDPEKENVGVNFPEKVLHPSNCDCDECTCLEDVMKSEDVCKCKECFCSQCPLKSGDHHDGCNCIKCLCFSCDYKDIGHQVGDQFVSAKSSEIASGVKDIGQSGDQCTCGICECSPEGEAKHEPEKIRQHSDECICGECVCVSESEVKMSGKQSQTTKPNEPSGGDGGGARGANCTCDVCLCIDCAGKQQLETPKADDNLCHCETCKCENCSRQRTDKEVSPKPDAKIANDKAVESCDVETVVDDKTLSAKPSVHVDETQVGDSKVSQPRKMEMSTSATIASKVSAQTHPMECDCPICYCERSPSKGKESGTQPTPKQSAMTSPEVEELYKVQSNKSAGRTDKPEDCTCQTCECPEEADQPRKVQSEKSAQRVPSQKSAGNIKTDKPEDCICQTCECSTQVDEPHKVQSQKSAQKVPSHKSVEKTSAKPSEHKTSQPVTAASSFKLIQGIGCDCESKGTPCTCPICPRMEDGPKTHKSAVGVGSQSHSKVAVTQKSSVRIKEPSGTQIEEEEIGHTPALDTQVQREKVDQTTSETHPDHCTCKVCECVGPGGETMPEKKPSAKISQHESQQQTKQPSTHGVECECQECDCSPGLLGQKAAKDTSQKDVSRTASTKECPPVACDCPHPCACQPECADPKIKKMPSSTIKQELEKQTVEKCRCKSEIKEILKALENIRCSCQEAEMRTSVGKTKSSSTHAVASSHEPTTAVSSTARTATPSSQGMSTAPSGGGQGKMFVKKASDFGQTMSGLKMALQNLQEKCKAKDRMISAMTGELELRGEDVDFDKVLDDARKLPLTDYDQADDVRSYDRSQLVSNIVLQQADIKDQGTEPIRNVSSKGVEVRTHKHKKKCSTKCDNPKDCNLHPILQKDEVNCQALDLSGFEIVDVRRITEDSLIVKWVVPGYDFIAGYDIFINGTLASKVMSGSRTSAMIHSLDLSKSVQITIYPVTKCGRLEPPAIAIYEIKS